MRKKPPFFPLIIAAVQAAAAATATVVTAAAGAIGTAASAVGGALGLTGGAAATTGVTGAIAGTAAAPVAGGVTGGVVGSAATTGAGAVTGAEAAVASGASESLGSAVVEAAKGVASPVTNAVQGVGDLIQGNIAEGAQKLVPNSLQTITDNVADLFGQDTPFGSDFANQSPISRGADLVRSLQGPRSNSRAVETATNLFEDASQEGFLGSALQELAGPPERSERQGIDFSGGLSQEGQDFLVNQQQGIGIEQTEFDRRKLTKETINEELRKGTLDTSNILFSRQ